MKLPAGAFISEEGWVIWGDEAWTPDEWRKRGDKRPYHRLTEEERKHYNRDWMRRYRAHQKHEVSLDPEAVGALHDLYCTGPTWATGCRCRKIPVYDRPREKAA